MPAVADVAAILILISSAAAARFRQNEKETAPRDLQSCAHVVGAAFAAFAWYAVRRPTDRLRMEARQVKLHWEQWSNLVDGERST